MCVDLYDTKEGAYLTEESKRIDMWRGRFNCSSIRVCAWIRKEPTHIHTYIRV